MELEYKAKVVDKEGQHLGTVDHLVRDTWTGELSKFVVGQPAPHNDLFLSVDDVLAATKDRVTLKLSAAEISQR